MSGLEDDELGREVSRLTTYLIAELKDHGSVNYTYDEFQWHLSAVKSAARRELERGEDNDIRTRLVRFAANMAQMSSDSRSAGKHLRAAEEDRIATEVLDYLKRSEEKEKPRRASLAEVENELAADSNMGIGMTFKTTETSQAVAIRRAALAKALRETVVPWLRKLDKDGGLEEQCGASTYQQRRCNCCHRLVLHEGGILPIEMLRALGEEP